MDIPALHTLTNGIIIGICLSISFGLVCFKQMAHAINPKYRRACHFFIAASLIIAAGHLAELLVDGFGVYRSLDLFSILVLVLASSQALMFTFMLILLFDSRFLLPDYANHTIEDIAGASGFKAMRTFNRNFRELVKMTPTEFRQQKSVL